LRVDPKSSGVLNLQGILACYEGDYDRATALCEEVLAGMRAVRWPHGVATVLHSLGLFGENGNKQRAVWCLGGLAAKQKP
jgi:hypothetical protein